MHCARCFTGCPHNAKNTTTTNYLYLAEQAGAEVHRADAPSPTSDRCAAAGTR